MKIDLQVHSLYSDGYHSPAQLARLLKMYQVKVASLTDHNTTAGQLEFKRACKKYNIKTVPGLELYVSYKGKTFNLLWYNYKDSLELQKMLAETWRRRRQFAEKVNLRLKRLGLRFNLNHFINKHPYYLPVNHWSDALWRSYHNRKIVQKAMRAHETDEGFLRYCFYPSKGARLQEARVSLSRVLKLRKKIGGQLIFCHPGLHNKLKGNLLESLVKAGVDGVELLSPHHSYSDIFHLSLAAKKYKLITTGGSDFHKAGTEGTKARYAWDWFNIDSKNLSKIKEII